MGDLETGEIDYDIETGERYPHKRPNVYVYRHPTNRRNSHIFKIPSNIITKSKDIFDDEEFRAKYLPFNSDISPIVLFLLPTLFVYPALTLILAVIEISIHMWAHRKNKTLNNPKYYFRSPLHSCVSVYCARCKEDNYMSTIGKLQDKRTMQYDCFKHLVS